MSRRAPGARDDIARLHPELIGDRFRGALVGAAVGDAFGAPFEGDRPSAKTLDELERSSRLLTYTDDTPMTMVLATSLLETDELEETHLAHTFAIRWQAEPHRGYGGGTFRLLEAISAGRPWHEQATSQFSGQGSLGNGGAMRVAPVALFAACDLELTNTLARRSAAVTHRNPLAMDAAAVQATAIALALAHSGKPLDPTAFLEGVRAAAIEPVMRDQLGRIRRMLEEDAAPEAAAEYIGHGVEAHTSVPAAVCSFLRNSGAFRDALRFALRVGGDTDTIASMTGNRRRVLWSKRHSRIVDRPH